MFKHLLALGLAFFSALAMAAVDVNSASAADLDSIKGVGPATSEKILEARKAGAFKDWSDLMARVKGIGAARAAKLSSQGLSVNGKAFEGAPAAAAQPAKADKPKAKPSA